MSQLDEVLALASDNTAGEFALSGETLAVLFYAADWLSNLNNWRDVPDEPLSDADIDTIQALVDNALDELMRPIVTIPVGATMIWHMATPPDRWVICDGGSKLKADYPELWALWGSKYGSSSTHFGAPDLRGNIPYGYDFTIGLDATYGEFDHTLTTAEMPSHNHAPLSPHTNFFGFRSGGTNTAPVGTALGVMATTANAGGGTPHNNMPPVLGVVFIAYGGKL